MARFDVYANPSVGERKQIPYLLDVQNDFIDSLGTRVVVPLRRAKTFGLRPRDLNPSITIGKDELVLDTALLGAVPASELRMVVARLTLERAEVRDALDTLFGSF